MHYDLFHRASRHTQRNLLGNVRFMFKLQFARTQAPGSRSGQTFSHYPDTWTTPATSGINEPVSMRDLLLPAWKSVHDWLSGTRHHTEVQLVASASTRAEVSADQLHKCTEVLRADGKPTTSELKRMYCAYTLGRHAKFAAASSDDANGAVSSLAIGMTSKTEAIRRASMYGLSAAGSRAVPVLLQILSESVDTTVPQKDITDIKREKGASGAQLVVKGAACHASGELQAEATVQSNLLQSVVRTADEMAQVSPGTVIHHVTQPH